MVQNQNANSCLGPAAKAPAFPGVTLCFFLAVSRLAIVEANFYSISRWGGGARLASHSLGIPVTYIHTENLLPF